MSELPSHGFYPFNGYTKITAAINSQLQERKAIEQTCVPEGAFEDADGEVKAGDPV